MAKKESKNSKLAINDRMLIQACIAKGEPAASIAERIGFSVSTVYKKIKRGSKIRNTGANKCAKIRRIGIYNTFLPQKAGKDLTGSDRVERRGFNLARPLTPPYVRFSAYGGSNQQSELLRSR